MKFKTPNGMERKKDRVTFNKKERKANMLIKSTSSFQKETYPIEIHIS
jgi:hypothetical protein